MENDLTSEHEQEATSREIIIVELNRNLFEELVKEWNRISHPELKLKVSTDYTIKEVVVKDDFFKDDEKYKELKKESVKAYKRLKEYEFNARHK
jgi:hypothetical protein